MKDDPTVSTPPDEFAQAANRVRGETICMAGVEPCSPGQMFNVQITSGLITKDEAPGLLGLTPSEFNDFLQGSYRVDKPLAEKLSEVSGSSAGFWMNVQAGYEFGQSERGQTLLETAPQPMLKMS